MWSKSTFLYLFGVLFVLTFSSVEAVDDATLGKDLKDFVDQAYKVLPWAWNITYEREDTVGNATDLMPVWNKLSQEIKDGKASPEVVKKLAERLIALAQEVADMEADELKIMPLGRELTKEARELAEKFEPKS